MHDQVKCRTLFATHYHELTRLAGRLDACRSTMSARASGRAIWSFCTKSPTAPPTAATASRSPSSPGFRRRSSPARKSVLAKLEAGRDATGGIAAGLDDLPLFAAAAEPEQRPIRCCRRWTAIEPDSLTPREALEDLYRLKRLAAERG